MKDSRGPDVDPSKDHEALCAVDGGVGQQTPPPYDWAPIDGSVTMIPLKGSLVWEPAPGGSCCNSHWLRSPLFFTGAMEQWKPRHLNPMRRCIACHGQRPANCLKIGKLQPRLQILLHNSIGRGHQTPGRGRLQPNLLELQPAAISIARIYWNLSESPAALRLPAALIVKFTVHHPSTLLRR